MTRLDPLRIGFVSEVSLTSRAAWSGTLGYMLKALTEAGGHVDEIHPILEGPTYVLNKVSRVVERVTGHNPMLNRTVTVAKQKARRLQQEARAQSVDLLFAPVGSSLIAQMPEGMPIAYCSDATVKLMSTYYPKFASMNPATLRRSINLERAALLRADLLIYPTHWAARSAIEDYGVDPARIMVQPLGANIDTAPVRADVMGARAPGPWRLLFCGVDWARKGGDIVLNALALLAERGVEAELTILGCTPPRDRVLPPNVTVIPYLNKSLPEEAARFCDLFAQADLLVLPTQAECYGLVFCEAAAFGTVSVATQTGGIPEVIRAGITGQTVAPGPDPRPWAEAIGDILTTPGKLEAMRHAAREDFDTRLNWGVWGQTVLPRMRGIAYG